jgi:1-deoxy-D-xylulose-5-phosphate reductoisomerase
MKNISILGSTGSIGTASLKIIESYPDRYKVVGLAGGRNIALMKEQIERFRPKYVAVIEENDARSLKDEFRGRIPVEILSGEQGLNLIATADEVNLVISAISGSAGLIPTYSAIIAGKDIALANKETLVMAGPLIISNAKKQGISILPVDSEHSAIFQCLQGHHRGDLRRIILTASGGPFLRSGVEEMRSVTPALALKHPNWKMGRKVTIDSATLMNKGLETIEAKWLFGLKGDQISILIHPQSIVHSMVEFMDGSIIAQLGVPDMITPISYALSYPRHLETGIPSLRLQDIGQLTFEEPDMSRFKCLELSLKAMEEGESMPAVLNAVNEVAVDLFLKERIGFMDIPELIERVMDLHHPFPIKDLNSVLEADRWARYMAFNTANQLEGKNK